ncbi:hypothetical protein IE53DRAFT_384855 [Violaceomyces palustris]|uniref:Uncharacterized protein n=1 Tax=Violaceomyces palustris TaxID=1673888 RepID=A0ACD0P3J9_9BASI|nr:hypothetical protein IE53DRAFT_384855 [Violaceomyces palustris]
MPRPDHHRYRPHRPSLPSYPTLLLSLAAAATLLSSSPIALSAAAAASPPSSPSLSPATHDPQLHQHAFVATASHESSTLNLDLNNAPTSPSSHPYHPRFPARKGNVIARIARYLSSLLPESDQAPSSSRHPASASSWELLDDTQSDQGLFGDAAGLTWGGSTLEVIRSQAIFFTRPAAFGPRISSEEGLRGSLLPIATFYDPHHDPIDQRPNSGCPVKGGPGWSKSGREGGDLGLDIDVDDLRFPGAFSDQDDESTPPLLRVAKNPTLKLPRPPSDWIALVERGDGCSFAAKVRLSQALGAIAVVVGDSPSPGWNGGKEGDSNDEGDPGLSGKRLITMFAPGDTSDIQIPSTFITRPSYLDLTRLIEEVGKEELERKKEQHPAERGSDKNDGDEDRIPTPRGLEIILSRDDMMWEWPLIDLGILLLLLPSFMTVTTIVVHRIRLIRQRRKERAPELVVLGLPCLIWRGGGQPWEKIEGPDLDPLPGSSQIEVVGGAGKTDPDTSSSSLLPIVDLESGPASESDPLLAEDENGAGPSRQRGQRGSTKSDNRPTPPANRSHSFLPPGRTYFSTDECAICLCDFVDGDRVRVLPCGHIFHRQEIDDWLVRVKKLCPICKRDITVPIPPAPPGPALHTPAAPPFASSSSSSTVADADATPVAGNSTNATEEGDDDENENQGVSIVIASCSDEADCQEGHVHPSAPTETYGRLSERQQDE